MDQRHDNECPECREYDFPGYHDLVDDFERFVNVVADIGWEYRHVEPVTMKPDEWIVCLDGSTFVDPETGAWFRNILEAAIERRHGTDEVS
jgi:hypothetical protein